MDRLCKLFRGFSSKFSKILPGLLMIIDDRNLFIIYDGKSIFIFCYWIKIILSKNKISLFLISTDKFPFKTSLCYK